MAVSDLFLVLLGSLFHLGWNVTSKQSKHKSSLLFFVVVVSSLLSFSFFIFQLFKTSFPQNFPYGLLIASAVTHAIYFGTLSKAYEGGDLSFVYPYCRGIGAILSTIASFVLLSDKPSTLGFIGILLTIIAVFLEPYEMLKKGKNHISSATIFFTIATGVLIAMYLVIDKIALQHVHANFYFPLMLALSTLLFFPIVSRRSDWRFSFNFEKKYILTGGILLLLGYYLILLGMVKGQLSYVVAARASGVVGSALVGKYLFKENLGFYRISSIILTCIGIYFISL